MCGESESSRRCLLLFTHDCIVVTKIARVRIVLYRSAEYLLWQINDSRYVSRTRYMKVKSRFSTDRAMVCLHSGNGRMSKAVKAERDQHTHTHFIFVRFASISFSYGCVDVCFGPSGTLLFCLFWTQLVPNTTWKCKIEARVYPGSIYIALCAIQSNTPQCGYPVRIPRLYGMPAGLPLFSYYHLSWVTTLDLQHLSVAVTYRAETMTSDCLYCHDGFRCLYRFVTSQARLEQCTGSGLTGSPVQFWYREF